jgi:acyl dehydratase
VAKIRQSTQAGEAFVGKPKTVSWERLWAFSGGAFTNAGWPRKNVHTDLEFAQSCGLPYVAASGTQFQGYVVELMIDLFGFAWLSHGTMDVKFINIVDAGDTLVAKAEVQSKEALDGGQRFIMDVCCENQNGSQVLVGSTTGVFNAPHLPGNQPDEPTSDSARAGGATGRQHLEPFEFVVTPELNQQYLYAMEDFHSWYLEETEFGPPIDHPAMLLNMSNSTRSPSYSQPAGRAGFHTRDETFFYTPARVGKKLRVTWEALDGYEKRGRLYSVNKISMVDQDGLEILRRFSHGTVASQEHRKEYRK